MTRTEDRLRELLHDHTPEPARDVRFDAVAARVRRRRALRAGSAATAAVLVLAGTAVLTFAHRHVPVAGPAVTATPTPSTSRIDGSGSRDVEFQGISVRVPAGWRVAGLPVCGFAPDRTVAVESGTRLVAACPMMLPPKVAPRTLSLNTLYGWQHTLGWDGTRTTWRGQPAFLSTSSNRGIAQAQLTLPWLNASVTATAATTAQARQLLDAVSVRVAGGMEVPARADAVEVQWFPLVNTKDGTYRSHVTRPQDVAALLADLRSGDSVTGADAPCPANVDADSAVLTVRDGENFRTFAATFGGCGQVVGGTGRASTVGPSLRADVVRLARLVPPMQPAAGGTGCGSTGGYPVAQRVGASTARAAFLAFLATRPAGFALDPAAWIEVDAGFFVDRYSEITIVKLFAPATGYGVEYTSNC